MILNHGSIIKTSGLCFLVFSNGLIRHYWAPTHAFSEGFLADIGFWVCCGHNFEATDHPHSSFEALCP